MENKTRKEIIVEERDRLMRKAVTDGFYYFEVGEMFKVTEGRISQIIKAGNNKIKKSKK